MLENLSTANWLLLCIAAFGIGITKSGFSGVSLVHVLIFAYVFEARASTGIVLPMLIAGDVIAMLMYGKHADWGYVKNMLGPAMLGVILGWMCMSFIPESLYRPIIGLIILLLALMQIARMAREEWFTKVPHTTWFAWMMGILVGITTMMANAAGPVFGLFLLAIGLPKREFVATASWFFLILNICKVPFSMNLGLIQVESLILNGLFIPLILIGLLVGRSILKRIPQRAFDVTILILSSIAALFLLSSGIFR